MKRSPTYKPANLLGSFLCAPLCLCASVVRGLFLLNYRDFTNGWPIAFGATDFAIKPANTITVTT